MQFRSDYAKQMYSALNGDPSISMEIYDETADSDATHPYVTIFAPLTDGRIYHVMNKDDASGAFPKSMVKVWDDSPNSSLTIKEKLDAVDDILNHKKLALGELSQIPSNTGVERDPDTGEYFGILRYELIVTN